MLAVFQADWADFIWSIVCDSQPNVLEGSIQVTDQGNTQGRVIVMTRGLGATLDKDWLKPQDVQPEYWEGHPSCGRGITFFSLDQRTEPGALGRNCRTAGRSPLPWRSSDIRRAFVRDSCQTHAGLNGPMRVLPVL